VHSILRHILFLLLFFAAAFLSVAQVDSSASTYFVVDNIEVEGNKRTKTFIIERELDFKIGDTVLTKNLDARLQRTHNRLFNTGLFLETSTQILAIDSTHKTVKVIVKERFFTYIVPIIGLADRNFNEWWVQRDHKFNRLDIGLYILQKNMRGRNESMKIKAEFGFTKKAEFTYTIPYLTKSRKLGVIYYVGYILNKQVSYNTLNNKLYYVEGSSFIRERFATGITFTYRSKFYIEHQLGIMYNNNAIGDTVAQLNPTYFSEGRTKQEFISLKYSLIRDHRDIHYYPLKGTYIRLDVEQMGVGLTNDIFLTSFKSEVSVYKPLKKRFNLAGTLKVKVSTPVQQPYFNQRGLGYDKETVSGYEQYVIDGQKYILGKVNFRYKLIDWKVTLHDLPDERFEKIPLKIFLKAYMDMGYVWDSRTNMYAVGNQHYANAYLPGAGIGFDFVSYYDFVMRVEYSVNRDLQSGVFINFKAGI